MDKKEIAELRKAAEARRSCRKYMKKPPEKENVAILSETAEIFCRREDLDIRVVLNDRDALGGLFSGIKKSYGFFSGARNYFAMIENKEEGHEEKHIYEEKLGYYGERLVLTATRLGLGTCWVGGTFDRDAVPCKFGKDKEVICLVVFGRASAGSGLRGKMISSVMHRKTKSVNDMLQASGDVPNWVIEGMRCVENAPSAVNLQPVMFTASDDMVSAKVKGKHRFDFFDMGIAKLHFELGAGGGTWEWGNGGIFQH